MFLRSASVMFVLVCCRRVFLLDKNCPRAFRAFSENPGNDL
jgi:hypothetical protein